MKNHTLHRQLRLHRRQFMTGTHRPCRFFSAIFVLALTSQLHAAESQVAAAAALPTHLELEALDGSIHDLQVGDGRVHVVSFWTTWCPPCLREMPSLERLSHDMTSSGLTVLAVNVGESRHRVRSFRRLPGGHVIVLLDRTGEHAAAWGVEVYPTAIVIDAHGRIAMRKTGVVDWDDRSLRAELQALLADSP